ncbi:hypothetical protein F4776DRAFT_626052 [Hypoxylon sp. NC0597]|nr:hypothetical protein F4776DRAFT_626052 [Hypoxylon sp. NC0597]
MATAVMASAPQSDLEKGLEPYANRTTSYIRDITYRVIPFCMAVLIIFSVGIVIVSTLHFDQPIPHQGTYVISILLAVLFFLFCIGIAYLYKKKHYPPLTKGPDAPDRPPGKGKFKNPLAMASTLFVDTLKVNKLSRHHKTEPDINFQGTPNNPAELNSPNLMNSQSHNRQQPHGTQGTGPSGITRDQIPRNDNRRSNSGRLAPPARKPVPLRPAGTKHRSGSVRNSFTPSQNSILEEPEENEQVYPHGPGLSAAYMPPSQRPSTANNTRVSRRDRETVSPMSQPTASPHDTGLLARTPTFQITGANGNSQVNEQRTRYPTTPPNPQGTGTARYNPIPALSPDSRPFRLSMDSADPIANLVQIPDNINEQAFVQAFPERQAKHGLYIFNNLPSLPNYELEAARFGGECHYYKKPRDRVHKRKAQPPQSYTDVPKRSPTRDSGYSEGVFSSAKSSLTRPAPALYSQEPIARNCGMTFATHGIEDNEGTRHISNEKGRPKGADSSSIRHRPHTERKHREASRRERKTTSRQNKSQADSPCPPDASLYPAPLKLPSRPPKTKSPSRKDPEEASWELVDLEASNSHKMKKGTKEKPLHPKRDRQQLTRNRSRMADTTWANGDRSSASMPTNQAPVDVRERHFNRMPMTVPPRSSSRFHEDITTGHRTASESSMSVSRD